MNKPFNVIQANYPELYEWLKQISRLGQIEKFILPDYKDELSIKLYTRSYRYCINVKLPEPNNPKDKFLKDGDKNYGYMSCYVITRKPRAGEDWNRGNDLADGDYSKETWYRIISKILAYELVKVARQPRELNK